MEVFVNSSTQHVESTPFPGDVYEVGPNLDCKEFAGPAESTSLWTVTLLLRRHIGEGAIGVVYDAFDTQRGQRAARKRLNQPSVFGVSRFKNEFHTLSDIKHLNVVRSFALFVIHSCRPHIVYFLLPYLRHEDRRGAVIPLRRRIAQRSSPLHTLAAQRRPGELSGRHLLVLQADAALRAGLGDPARFAT